MRIALETPPTKERLLDAAQELMLAKGFAATTVDEICEKAKLTKGSFFHYFESKDELGKELLERFCEEGARRNEALFGQESDPLKRVYHYIDAMVKHAQETATGKGCLLGTFCQELSDVSPKIREVCAKAFAAWAKRFGEELAEAKAKYAAMASFDPQSLAEHFIAIQEGSLILGKAKKDMKVVQRNLLHFKEYLKSLFKR